VKEYTPAGDVVRTIRTDLPELGGREAKNWPFTAILLEDDQVLVNLTNGNKAAIFDKAGKVVWSAKNDDVGGRFADPCGGGVLDNGNIIVCSYGQKDDQKADVFEVNRDKKVVWEFKAHGYGGVHEIHILTTNGKKVASRR
jgi:outer membrane protein assembly factor BamB